MFICLRCKEIRPEWIEIITKGMKLAMIIVQLMERMGELEEKRRAEEDAAKWKPETTGEILKKLGIKREKIKKPEQIHVKLEQKPPIPEQKPLKLEHKWGPLIEWLKNHPTNYTLKINKNWHYGKIRGSDILIAARRDFKRMGIDVEVKLMGDYGTIRLLSGPSQEAR